jgi:hypothetical protein
MAKIFTKTLSHCSCHCGNYDSLRIRCRITGNLIYDMDTNMGCFPEDCPLENESIKATELCKDPDGEGYYCTLPKGHDEAHHAFDDLGRILKSWLRVTERRMNRIPGPSFERIV